MTYTISNYYPEHQKHPAFQNTPECKSVTEAISYIDIWLDQDTELDISHFSITEWGIIDGQDEITRTGCADRYQLEER